MRTRPSPISMLLDASDIFRSDLLACTLSEPATSVWVRTPRDAVYILCAIYAWIAEALR